QDVRQADAVRVTAAGAYHWRYLVRAFSYVDLVFVDTPLADIALAKHLSSLAEMTDMTVRFERVRAFLGYLQKKETDELAAAGSPGPFQEALIPQIFNQVEAEIDVISKKVPGANVYGKA